MNYFPGNPNLRDSIRLWRHLGGEVTPVFRTGELDFCHPSGVRTRVNCRRKDSPAHLTKLLRRLAADQGPWPKEAA